MVKPTKLSGQELVLLFIENTQHPMKKEIEVLCDIIGNSGVDLTQHIKWNAPSFCYMGDDRITLKLNSHNSVDLVFHRGSKVKTIPTEKLIEESTQLLKWITNDRGIVSFSSLDDIQTNKESLIDIIKKWVVAAE